VTSDHDLFRFLHFVRRSGDLAFARRITRMLDTELQALPRDTGVAPSAAARVLSSVVEQLALGAA